MVYFSRPISNCSSIFHWVNDFLSNAAPLHGCTRLKIKIIDRVPYNRGTFSISYSKLCIFKKITDCWWTHIQNSCTAIIGCYKTCRIEKIRSATKTRNGFISPSPRIALWERVSIKHLKCLRSASNLILHCNGFCFFSGIDVNQSG